jgi:hypothetical protein
MKIRKNKKPEEQVRRRVSGVNSDGQATKFNYHSVRSSAEVNQGRTNREHQTELSDKTKNNWIKHIPTLIAILVVIGSIIYALTLSTNPRVVIIGQTNQTIMQPTSEYQQVAQKLFSGSLLNRTKITVNTVKLANQLEQQFPELNGVSIIVPLIGRTPILEIRPSQSILILSNSQGQYVINQQGNAVLKLDSSVANTFSLPVVTDKSGFNVVVGKEVLPSTSITFIKTVIDQFNKKNIPIQSMTLSTNPYELDVQVRGVPYFIKFNLLADPLYSVGTYFSVVKLFTPANPGPTQYIDIRIPGRAFYK